MSGLTARAMLGGGAAFVLLGGAWLVLGRSPARGVKRPQYIFLNETENHAHDTALKNSLKIAEKRSGIENALVLLKRLTPRSTIRERGREPVSALADRPGPGSPP